MRMTTGVAPDVREGEGVTSTTVALVIVATAVATTTAG